MDPNIEIVAMIERMVQYVFLPHREIYEEKMQFRRKSPCFFKKHVIPPAASDDKIDDP